VKACAYVRSQCDRWFILSAKHGLVHPDQEISPYDETLNDKARSEREAWAAAVWENLRPQLYAEDRVLILAGKR